MKSDPLNNYVTSTITAPPSQGPGSGKAAWVAYARERAEACATLWEVIDNQSGTIRELQAEIELLRSQIETRKPKGGRPRLHDEKVARIEADLAAGYSRRQVAGRCGVSAMTVTRVARRVAEREAQAD